MQRNPAQGRIDLGFEAISIEHRSSAPVQRHDVCFVRVVKVIFSLHRSEIFLSYPRTMRLVQMPNVSALRNFNAAALWAGITTFVWFATGMVPLQIALSGQVGMDTA